MTPTSKHPPHPVAELFPMLGEEELAELAASIKEQGLLTPIVLDKHLAGKGDLVELTVPPSRPSATRSARAPGRQTARPSTNWLVDPRSDGCEEGTDRPTHRSESVERISSFSQGQVQGSD
jgi:hypothetical protein